MANETGVPGCYPAPSDLYLAAKGPLLGALILDTAFLRMTQHSHDTSVFPAPPARHPVGISQGCASLPALDELARAMKLSS
jgi:hypothetical protein